MRTNATRPHRLTSNKNLTSSYETIHFSGGSWYTSAEKCIRLSSYLGKMVKREKGAKNFHAFSTQTWVHSFQMTMVSEAVPERGADKAGGRFTALGIWPKFSTLNYDGWERLKEPQHQQKYSSLSLNFMLRYESVPPPFSTLPKIVFLRNLLWIVRKR